jgi:hypothetical protein
MTLAGRFAREEGMLVKCRYTLGIALVLFATRPAISDCGCGPDFCQNDPRITKALAEKKSRLSAAGFPARLTGLLDVGDQCYARITRSPDNFTLWLVQADGNKVTASWNADDEARAKAQLASGQLKRFWIFNTAHAFSCCGQPSYDRRSDYNSGDDVNTSTAILCDKQHTC